MPAPTLSRPLPQRLLLILGLLGAITMALWLPPFAGPDEVFHWYRAVHVSSGHVLSQKQDGSLGDRLPIWAEGLYRAIPASSLAQDERVTATMWHSAQAVPYATQQSFVAFAPTAMYPPTFYLPQALAIRAARLCHVQPLTAFYIARVANACVAWWVIAQALLWAYEWIFFWGALLLLPVVLQQLGTLSPDALMIASTLWLCTLVRRAITCREPSPRLIYNATLIIGLLAQARPPLVALVALLWMPAFARHAHGPILRLRLICSFVACAMAFPWFVGCLIWGVPLRLDLPPVHDKALVMLHHPVVFIALLWRTTTVNFHGYLWMLVGSLGWLNAPISPEAFSCAKASLSCGLLASLGRPYKVGGVNALCLWLAIIGSYCGMQVIFFLTWTSPNAAVIEGFQGRYAMMFLPLLAMALPSMPWPHWLLNALRCITFGCALRAMAAIPWALLARYYF